MIASFMAYAFSAGLLLALAAWGFEGVLRSFRRPARFVWLLALLGTVALAIAAPLRMEPDEPLPALTPEAYTSAPLPLSALEEEERSTGWKTAIVAGRDGVRNLLEMPMTLAARAGAGSDRALGFLWISLTLLLIAAAGATALRYRALRLRWPRGEVEGVPVRLSPGTGPALIGILKPEIVVPAWLLEASPEERRLALLHEGEHLRTGDSYLLSAGCLVAALLPWNPAVWWMLYRLRIALEIDCDHRVLQQGVDHRSYGTMLIDISGQQTGLTLGSPALAGFPSNLERRLLAMTMKGSKGSTLRGAVLGIVGVVAVLAACDSPLPTTAEIEAMDAAEAVVGLEELRVIRAHEEVRFFRDGTEITREEAMAIEPAEIDEIRVDLGEGERTIRIAGTNTLVTTVPVDGAFDTIYATSAARDERALELRVAPGDPLYLIDNVPATREAFDRLNPADIETVHLLRDEAAEGYGEGARHGVLVVATKGGSWSQGEVSPVGYGTLGSAMEVRNSGCPEGSTPSTLESDENTVQVCGYRVRSLDPSQVIAGIEVRRINSDQVGNGDLQVRNMGEPLYLIDDVPATAADFYRLNPADIRSISILKVDAAAERGFRDAGGVIQVVTH